MEDSNGELKSETASRYGKPYLFKLIDSDERTKINTRGVMAYKTKSFISTLPFNGFFSSSFFTLWRFSIW